MSKATFGQHDDRTQRELCLKYAAEVGAHSSIPVMTSAVAKLCIERKIFSDEQLEYFQLEGVRRQVQRWLKTRDDTGLELWGQIPFADESGEMFWQERKRMKVSGYAWNYILRDDLVEKNRARRDRWRDEGVLRFGEPAFEAEVARLRMERNRGAA